MLRPRLGRFSPRKMRSIRYWGMELLVVVVGVLLALWTAEWAEGRREAAEHAERVERMNAAIVEVLALEAAARAGHRCEDARMAELKALLDEHGRNWPGAKREQEASSFEDNALFPLPIVMNLEAIPLEPFEAAEASGTIASLAGEDADYYRVRHLQLQYLDDAFDRSLQSMLDLRVLSEPRLLSQGELDAARRALSELDFASRIRRVQGQGLLDSYKDRNGEFGDRFWRIFEANVKASDYRDDGCFAPIDPRDGSPWQGRD